MEQSQSASCVPCSGWLAVSVSGLLRCSLIAVGTRESLWQLPVSPLQDEQLGLWSCCTTSAAKWFFGAANYYSSVCSEGQDAFSMHDVSDYSSPKCPLKKDLDKVVWLLTVVYF